MYQAEFEQPDGEVPEPELAEWEDGSELDED
jgi:hypothetical protein